jgi:long-chain acyl-CoA synthetase
MTETVADLFLSALDRFPERTLMREFRGRSWTYREAAQRVAATVRSLGELGIEPGDRLVCYLEDITEAVFMQLACAHRGVITVHFSPRLSAESAAEVVERVEARGLFSTPALAPALHGRGLRLIEPAIAWEGSDAAAREALGSQAAARRSGDIYMYQPTSGTTGSFNLVMRTHAPFLHVAKCQAVGFRAEEPARFSWAEPLTHGPGHYDLCTVLWLGGEGVIPSERDAAASLAELRALDPVEVGGPPRLIRSLYKQYLALGGEASGPWFGPSAKVLISGGGIAELEAHRVAERQGLDVVEVYGMTETGFLAMTERGHWRPGYVGRVLPGAELKVAPDGELLARTPWQMLGYFSDPGLTAARTSDGFFRTGDYCEVTADGMLKYLGRKKDVFNTPDGSNIHPAHIEQLILDFDWVRQAALVGDGEPFLVALLVVAGVPAAAANVTGYLDPPAHAALYARAAADLAALNRTLARNEQVRRFALFDRPMSDELYKLTGQGKIGRNRKAIQLHYRDELARLYSDAAPPLATVPNPADR